ncbi:hypothetical protein LZ198_02125 [Myxococcus sp. K15C18031901]|uniref:hypothetical protein n=1 Tax=Myxococcus dinghuensis TaxID=2906761 RepID=UPI0020A82424|nr:hypothetical protein [Myxococcus dinghuensis]MCP3097668.1 hypothetical protein [Myxococcus dinghuensis]
MVFVGGMPCGICGKPIEGRPGARLPHFVRNRLDPLFPLSGLAFHEACFENHPLRELAERRSEEYLEKVKEPHRRCVVCGEEIDTDWYNTWYLSGDPSSPLYEFNYLHFHRQHLHAWARYEEFRRLVEVLEASGSYVGPPILPD